MARSRSVPGSFWYGSFFSNAQQLVALKPRPSWTSPLATSFALPIPPEWGRTSIVLPAGSVLASISAMVAPY